MVQLDSGQAPTFVCIGGQRCGSSWLYLNLREHPQIQMSSKKELNFFSKLITSDGMQTYCDYFRDDCALSGEISPTYSAMFPGEISLIKELVPDLKIVFIVRNPVERLISQITRQWSYSSHKAKKDLLSLMRQVDSSLSRRLTDYETAYKNWCRFYGKDNVYIAKYDVLKQDPELFMKQILSFLGADANFVFPDETFSNRKNVSKPQTVKAVPDMLKWYIACEWIDKVKKMNQSTDLDLQEWVDTLEREAARSRWYYHLLRAFHKCYFYIPYNFIYGILNPLRIKIRVCRSRKNVIKATSPTSS